MTKQFVLRIIFPIGTILVLPVFFLVLGFQGLVAKGANMPWPIPACVVALAVLCILLLFVTYKKTALTRQAEQGIKQEAEQLFVGDLGGAIQKDIVLLDKAGSLQIGQEDLFNIVPNEDTWD